MIEYPKIQSVFKRDPKTKKFLEWRWSLPEFQYMSTLTWVATEKVDGTNIRIHWDGQNVRFGGRTSNAQIPIPILDVLMDKFTPGKFSSFTNPITLFGEGYGGKIQNGNIYRPDPDFILFDVVVGDWWLERDNIQDVADKVGCNVVPIIDYGTLAEFIALVKYRNVRSILANDRHKDKIEGIVCKPLIELRNRSGHRIITKIKIKDFADD